MRHIFHIIAIVALTVFTLAGVYQLLARKEAPERFIYGVSFNTMYARELGLDWREVYDAILSDLGVRHLRLAAHWPMVEPQDDVFNFEELDYQIARAEEEGAEVILAVGRRLPRWPECHVPDWAMEISWEERKLEIQEYIEMVVERYRDSDAVVLWQVENEPFLEVFAKRECGDLDVSFLEKEVELVRTLDATRPILLTDSGNLGTWFGAYKRADVFGTSAYRYLWNPDIGPFTSRLPGSFYRVKENVMAAFFGEKETILIELSAEPWLLQSVVDTPLSVQLERMDVEKFEEILDFARQTYFTKQYLWGAEWWFWLRGRGEEEMWKRAKEIFAE